MHCMHVHKLDVFLELNGDKAEIFDVGPKGLFFY